MLGRLFTGKEKNGKEKKLEHEYEEHGKSHRKPRPPAISHTKKLPAITLDSEIKVQPEKPKRQRVQKSKDIEVIKTDIAGDYTIEQLLDVTDKLDISDIYINAECPPCFRLYEQMIKSDLDIISEDKVKEMLYQVCTEEQIEDLETSGEVRFPLQLNERSRYRVSICKQNNGYGSVFKRIACKIPSFDALNVPDVLKDIALYNRGLVIITGPSKSGKSSTMASIIDYINENSKKLIITIENPVEYIFESKNSIVIQREIGTNVYSYKEGLQAILQEEPDVLFIGEELNDRENILMLLKAVEMGTLVFCFLNNNNSQNAIKKILNFFPKGKRQEIIRRLSAALKAVIAQKLILKQDKKGQILATEIMLNTMEITELIRTDRTGEIYSFMSEARVKGMKTMNDSLCELIKEHLISQDTAKEAGFISSSVVES
ncbi:MAG: PilT/PilU family type 4a pilus ATPase [Candidatus Eremiobacterota bacterium]